VFKQLSQLGLFVLIGFAGFVKAETALQDPTKPLRYSAAKKAAEMKLVLNSVLISPHRKIAVINGQGLAEQDTIKGSGGVILERILPHEVVLEKAGKRWRIRLQHDLLVQKTTVNQ